MYNSWLNTVSYTHLDVYKRQRWYYFWGNGTMALGLSPIPGNRKAYYTLREGMLKGWQQPDGYWYYFDLNTGDGYKGEINSLKNISGQSTWYYFDPTTRRLAEGLTTLPDGRQVYYTREKGMNKGLVTLKSAEGWDTRCV